MREYSVTITLAGRNRSDIKRRLRSALGASVAEQCKFVTPEQLLSYYEQCEANDHFGCVHWAEEDLITKLKELNIKATPERIDDIKSTYAIRHIADRMIERGWEVIER